MARQYEVIADHKVYGFAKGERFYADLTPEQERRKLGVTLAIVREPTRRRGYLNVPDVNKQDEGKIDG